MVIVGGNFARSRQVQQLGRLRSQLGRNGWGFPDFAFLQSSDDFLAFPGDFRIELGQDLGVEFAIAFKDRRQLGEHAEFIALFLGLLCRDRAIFRVGLRVVLQGLQTYRLNCTAKRARLSAPDHLIHRIVFRRFASPAGILDFLYRASIFGRNVWPRLGGSLGTSDDATKV